MRARASDGIAADRALRAIQRSTRVGDSLALKPWEFMTKSALASTAIAQAETAPPRNHAKRCIGSFIIHKERNAADLSAVLKNVYSSWVIASHHRQANALPREGSMNPIVKWVGISFAVLILIVLSLPFLINADQFRPTLQSDLSTALGRPVTLGSLHFKILAGEVTADDLRSLKIRLSANLPF
jgi:hypothetical protein